MRNLRRVAAAVIVGSLIGVTPAVAQEPSNSGVVLCLRPLIPEKLIDLPLFNFPGGAIPPETQVVGFFMSDDVECPE